MHIEQYSHAQFTDLQTSLFSNFFIKNESHNIIHTFKNYFATIFSIFSKINYIQIYPEILVKERRRSKFCFVLDSPITLISHNNKSRCQFLPRGRCGPVSYIIDSGLCNSCEKVTSDSSIKFRLL